MSVNKEHSFRVMEDLIEVFDKIELYVEDVELWDEAVVNEMHLKRQALTAELVKSLPVPTPTGFENILVTLQRKTQSLLKKIGTSQRETRDAMSQLQNYRKAKHTYEKIGNH